MPCAPATPPRTATPSAPKDYTTGKERKGQKRTGKERKEKGKAERRIRVEAEGGG
jgi:hypothetical protein